MLGGAGRGAIESPSRGCRDMMRHWAAWACVACMCAPLARPIRAQQVPPQPGVKWTEEQLLKAVAPVRAGRKLTPKTWPNNSRVAVCLSFDDDNESYLLASGNTSPTTLSTADFGAQEGLPRILALLDKYNIPSTFFIPAVSALLHPEMIPAIMKSGIISGWSSALTAGMKNVDGMLYLSSSARIRGRPSCAPKSAVESVVGDVLPLASRYDSLSSSKLRHTATRELLGQVFGVSLRPARTGATALSNCSSVHLTPGCGGTCCARIGLARGAHMHATHAHAAQCLIMSRHPLEGDSMAPRPAPPNIVARPTVRVCRACLTGQPAGWPEAVSRRLAVEWWAVPGPWDLTGGSVRGPMRWMAS